MDSSVEIKNSSPSCTFHDDHGTAESTTKRGSDLMKTNKKCYGFIDFNLKNKTLLSNEFLYPFFKLVPVIFVMVLLAIMLLEFFHFYRSLQMPQLEKIEIFLDPASNLKESHEMWFSSSANDIVISANTKNSFSKSFTITSYQTKSVSCEFFHSPSFINEFDSLAKLNVKLLESKWTPGEMAVAEVVNINYNVLRSIYFDLVDKETVQSQVEASCTMHFLAIMWQSITINFDFKIRKKIRLDEIRERIQGSSTKKTDIQGNQTTSRRTTINNETASQQSSKFSHISWESAQYDFAFSLGEYFKPPASIESLILHIPKVSYATALVDKVGEAKSYLSFSINPISIDFVQVSNWYIVEIQLTCTPYDVYEGSEELKMQSTGSCSLISPFDLKKLRYEYFENGFVNITSKATIVNSVTKFLGVNHFIRSVEKLPSHIAGFEPNKNTSSPTENFKLLRRLASVDPTISTGSNCVMLDTDGVYFSGSCSVVEAGFFELLINTYDDEGYVGYFESVTSWATSGLLAFESKLMGSYVNIGDIASRTVFSENYHNLTFSASMNSSVGNSLVENLNCEWNIGDSNGIIAAESLTFINQDHPIQALGKIQYGHHQYKAEFKASDNFNKSIGNTFDAYAFGNYAGEWDKW